MQPVRYDLERVFVLDTFADIKSLDTFKKIFKNNKTLKNLNNLQQDLIPFYTALIAVTSSDIILFQWGCRVFF